MIFYHLTIFTIATLTDVSVSLTSNHIKKTKVAYTILFTPTQDISKDGKIVIGFPKANYVDTDLNGGVVCSGPFPSDQTVASPKLTTTFKAPGSGEKYLEITGFVE